MLQFLFVWGHIQSCSGIVPKNYFLHSQGTNGMLGIKPALIVCKVSVLPTALSYQSPSSVLQTEVEEWKESKYHEAKRTQVK